MSKISIALCTYNGAKFLPEQLESFLKQTRLPDEIVVGDDCSSDETVKILEAFARRASFPVHLKINEKNLGSTKNFEQTISRCAGEIIFLSDQDDVWLPQKIERVINEFEKSKNLGIVFTDAELVDENLKPLGAKLCDLTFRPALRHIKAHREMLALLLPRNYFTGATMIFRARFRKIFLPFPLDIPEMIHDAWLAFVIIAMADFKFLDEPLIKYRQHDKQQLGVIFLDEFAKLPPNEKFQKGLQILETERERVEKIQERFNQNPKLRQAAVEINGLTEKCIFEINEKVLHYEARKNLPTLKIKRIFPIWREVQSGRYHRFSRGFLSALKDAASSG